MAAKKDTAPEKSAEEIIAEARAEAERILAEARAKAEAPAEIVPKTAGDPMEELVEYTAPLAPAGERPDILASVNGETIRIMRGETVSIKRKFIEVLDNAARQEMAARRAMQNAQNAGRRALADM